MNEDIEITEHEEHPPLTINPKELNAGSVLVISEVGNNKMPPIMTQAGSLHMATHDGSHDKNLRASPMEWVLGALALCVMQSLKMTISHHKMEVPKLAVAVSQSRKNERTNIKCEVIVEAHLNEVGRELLKDAVNLCPTRQVSNADIETEIIIS